MLGTASAKRGRRVAAGDVAPAGVVLELELSAARMLRSPPLGREAETESEARYFEQGWSVSKT